MVELVAYIAGAFALSFAVGFYGTRLRHWIERRGRIRLGGAQHEGD